MVQVLVVAVAGVPAISIQLVSGSGRPSWPRRTMTPSSTGPLATVSCRSNACSRAATPSRGGRGQLRPDPVAHDQQPGDHLSHTGKRYAVQPLIEQAFNGCISQVCLRGGKICPIAPVQPVKIDRQPGGCPPLQSPFARRPAPAAPGPQTAPAADAACPDGTGAGGGPPAHPAVISTAQPATAAVMAQALRIRPRPVVGLHEPASR